MNHGKRGGVRFASHLQKHRNNHAQKGGVVEEHIVVALHTGVVVRIVAVEHIVVVVAW